MRKPSAAPLHLSPRRFGLTHTLISLAVVVLTVAECCPVVAQTYTITDLGTLGGDNSRALGINNKGMVVGAAGTHQTAGAFVWKPAVPNGTAGIMSEIGRSFFGNKIPAAAVAINDFPQEIADETDTEVFAPNYVWQDGASVFLVDAACWAINNSGQVAGSGLAPYDPRYTGRPKRAMLWKPYSPNGTNGTMVFIGGDDTEAYGINDYGQVVGTWGFLWTPTTPNGTNGSVVSIGDLGPGTFVDAALAINGVGQVAGALSVYDAAANCWCDHAFLWTPTRPNGPSGTMRDLGVLSASPDVLNTSYASSINASGQVVGVSTTSTGDEHAFLWDRLHGLRDLNSLLPPNSSWRLFEAWGINDYGQIAASGFVTIGRNVYNRAVLLTPVRPPRLTSSAALSSRQFQFTLIGQARRSYTLQASTNLVTWTALTNFVSATGTNQFTDTAAPNFNRRFYRAVTP